MRIALAVKSQLDEETSGLFAHKRRCFSCLALGSIVVPLGDEYSRIQLPASMILVRKAFPFILNIKKQLGLFNAKYTHIAMYYV